MFTDNGLRLATTESVATAFNSGGDGLGETSVNLALEAGALTQDGSKQIDAGVYSETELSVTVTTAFTSGTDNATSEFQLVSLPIALSLLTNGAGGAADGKQLAITAVAGTLASPSVWTIATHGLPLATPVFLTSFGGGLVGPTANVVYYVVPLSANTFTLATTLTQALTGVGNVNVSTAGTATVNFIPFVHATTGPILRPFLAIGTQHVARVQPYAVSQMPKLVAPYSGAPLQPLGVAVTTPPSGGAANPTLRPYRYLALRHKSSATITAGSITVDLCLNSQNIRRSFASQFTAV